MNLKFATASNKDYPGSVRLTFFTDDIVIYEVLLSPEDLSTLIISLIDSTLKYGELSDELYKTFYDHTLSNMDA